jgi:hypothetical protein
VGGAGWQMLLNNSSASQLSLWSRNEHIVCVLLCCCAAAALLLCAQGISSGSGKSKEEKVGKVTKAQVEVRRVGGAMMRWGRGVCDDASSRPRQAAVGGS